jgi:putative glycosyltransferase
MKLSIVTTLYHSQDYIEEFYQQITKQAKTITSNYELIFVNDGSPDNSSEIAIKLHNQDKKVIVINLSKNFGHHKAIMTGLSHAKGDFIFLIDVDLDESPKNLKTFWNEIQKDLSLDVVLATKCDKKGSFLRKLGRNFFYNSFNYLSGTKISPNHLVSRLMKKTYVEALLRHKERNIFLAALCIDIGFNQKAIETPDHSYGFYSTYTFKKKISMAIDAITSYSSKPLFSIFILGTLISFLSFLFIIYILFRNIFFNAPLLGWSSMIISIYFIGGVIILSLGIIGIYLSKIYMEVKARPYNLIKSIYKKEK